MNDLRTNVLVSHRIPLVRVGLIAALSMSHNLRVRAQSDDRDATDAGPSTLRREVIVTDPPSALQALTREAASGMAGAVPVLLIVREAEQKTLSQAWRLGVRGYASLATPGSALIRGVEALANGLPFCCSTVHMPSARAGDSPSGGQPANGGLAPAALRRVREHIEARLSDRLGLEELAAIAHLSEGHFARAFRQSVGISPCRYIKLRRIALASERIRHTHVPLGEIALQSGFADQSHFTRLFVNQMGETPSEFRRRHR